jgi:hypothetical protein
MGTGEVSGTEATAGGDPSLSRGRHLWGNGFSALATVYAILFTLLYIAVAFNCSSSTDRIAPCLRSP